jgi:hypothetical protein
VRGLKNAELAHGHAAEALAFIGGGSAGVRINPDAAHNSKTRMLCDEILPASSLTEQGAEEIVSNPPITAGWPDTCLLDGSRGGARDIRVHRSRSAQLGVERTAQNRDDAAVRGAARVASQEDPARCPRIDTRRLQNLREEYDLRDPRDSIGAAAEGILSFQQGCKTLCLPVGQ